MAISTLFLARLIAASTGATPSAGSTMIFMTGPPPSPVRQACGAHG